MAMPIQRSGIDPFEYIGVEPGTPYKFVIFTIAPTADFFNNFDVGTVWLKRQVLLPDEVPDADDGNVWMLVNKAGTVSTWKLLTPSVTPGLITLTGNSGGKVGADSLHNINFLSGFAPFTLDGNAGAWSITLNSDGTVADQFDEDTGSAVPVAGVLRIVGGPGVATSGSGNTVTVSAHASLATQYDGNTGSAVPVANVLNIVGSSTVSTSGAGSTITITDSAYSLVDYVTDAGTATPAANILNIFGGTNISTSGAGDTVTATLASLGGPGVVVTDSSGDASVINGLDGQVIIAATGLDPIWAFITSSDNSIIITPGPNTLDLSAPGGGIVTPGENINITPTAVVNLNTTIRWPNTGTDLSASQGYFYNTTQSSAYLHNHGPATGQNTFYGIFCGLGVCILLGTNTAVGRQCFANNNVLSTVMDCTAIGNQCIGLVDTSEDQVNAQGCTGFGEQCLRNAVGSFNTGFGNSCWELVKNIAQCTGFGTFILQGVTRDNLFDNIIAIGPWFYRFNFDDPDQLPPDGTISIASVGYLVAT